MPLNPFSAWRPAISLSTRIFGGFATILVLLAALVAVQLRISSTVELGATRVGLDVTSASATTELELSVADARATVKQFASAPTAANQAIADKSLTRLNETVAGQAQEASTRLAETVAAYRRSVNTTVATIQTFQAGAERIRVAGSELGTIASAIAEHMADVDEPGLIKAGFNVALAFRETDITVMRFLRTRDPVDVAMAKVGLQDMQERVGTLAAKVADHKRLSKFVVALAKPLQSYAEALNEVVIADDSLRKASAVREIAEASVMSAAAKERRHDTDSLRTAADGMRETVGNGRRIGLITAAIAITLGVVLAFVIGRGITRGIRQLKGAMERLVHNELETAIPGIHRHDEIGAMAGGVLVFQQHMVREQQLTKERLDERQREAGELRERARLATEANSAKSAFLAMMSHEIRTPMNAMLGLASALLTDELSGGQRRMVSVIRESGEALLRILDDILDYSKLDAGRLTFESVAISPATLAHEAVSVHGPAAMAKGLSIHATVDPAIPESLLGDAGRIRQVLMNLVSNAVKFTDTGAIIIRVSYADRDHGTVSVVWEVRDTGIGISQEQQGRLFAEFVQADDSITRRFGGTGLGLAISRRIVEQMGGEIEMESQPGLGSVFRFRLTLARAIGPAVEVDAPLDHAAALRAALLRLGRPARLLVAEDNPTNQFVLEQLLRTFDLAVDIVGDGEAAVAAVSAAAYDAVLMDMRMPKMDGLEATRAIRRLGGTAASIPIIALTANTFPSDVQACLAAGMNYFVAKPVASDRLFRALGIALSEPNEATTQVQPTAAAEEPGTIAFGADTHESVFSK